MIFIREIKLPGDCNGFTIQDNEKNYNVYLNHEISDEKKKATLKHELCHIQGGDFNRYDVVEKIEANNRSRCFKEWEIEDEVQSLGYVELGEEKK